MGVESLEKGHKIQIADGSTAEVLGPAEGNRQVPVRILDSPFGPDEPGTEKKVDSDEINGVYTDDSMTEVRAL